MWDGKFSGCEWWWDHKVIKEPQLRVTCCTYLFYVAVGGRDKLGFLAQFDEDEGKSHFSFVEVWA